MSMEIKTEKLEDYKIKVNYIANTDVVKEKNKEALDQLRTLKEKVPGFRPGKANDLALRVRFKDRIEQWVKSEMVSQANDDIMFDTKIKPIGKPHFESVVLDGNTFKLEAVYNGRPDFELSEYKGLEIPNPHLEKSQEDLINEYLQILRTKHSDIKPYEDDDFVQDGDKVTLEYKLSNGKEEEGKLYEVGSNLFHGFDHGLLGMKAGESKTFDVIIDNDKVSCDVTVHMGLKSVPCPLDETLAQRCGVQSIEEVVESIKTITENNLKSERDNKLAEQIKLKLLDLNKFEPPQWLVNQEAEFVARHRGLTFSSLDDEQKKDITSEASKNIRFTLILDEIKGLEPEVNLEEQQAINNVKNILMQQGVQNVEGYLNKAFNDGSLFGIVERMKNDYIVKWLIDNAKVVE